MRISPPPSSTSSPSPLGRLSPLPAAPAEPAATPEPCDTWAPERSPAPRGSWLRSLTLGACGVAALGGAVLSQPPSALHHEVSYPRARYLVQSTEDIMGERMAAQVAKTFSPWSNVEAQARVDRIGARLAETSTRSDLHYQFALIDSKDLNAFSIPGGRIYVTRGLLEKMSDDDQLTYVLAHEMGHSERSHSMRKLDQELLQGLTTLPLRIGLVLGTQSALGAGMQVIEHRYGQANELEADRLGVEHIARLGISSNAAIAALSSLPDVAARWSPWAQNILLDHPTNAARIEAIRLMPQPGYSNVPTAQ